MRKYLDFIDDEKLISAVQVVLSRAAAGFERADSEKAKHDLDPFSAVFDCSLNGLSPREWLGYEDRRKKQKALQNAIGEFHQAVLGGIDGWRNLGTGQLVDVISDSRKIVAEIKNKYNTTKGNHKREVYNDLSQMLSLPEYVGYTAYYVEILSQGGKKYSKPFVPSDNRSGKRLREDASIIQIDGRSFYELATGSPNALQDVFFALPKVLCDLGHSQPFSHSENDHFLQIFQGVYK